ncbi:hypothetical protein [Streptomyces luteocolor]|uniref:hypothetical protein n=1 Tax=Streptomyces luteocolor TaxID=285500 RepID=UPI001EDBB40D|nr:hypothetical protein [Streptomyces luteocolor]
MTARTSPARPSHRDPPPPDHPLRTARTGALRRVLTRLARGGPAPRPRAAGRGRRPDAPVAGGLFGAWAVGSLANGAIEQYSLALPWGTLLLVCLSSLAIGAVAAAVPARRAAALGPLEAAKEA